ncbi:hypothetical protein TNCV_2791881 [Trichonephila clavipes]|nr:hypothetical protein TNCV_2791881 [Trichonephila clavipes]
MAPPTSCLKVKKKTRLDASHQSITMDKIDAFFEPISTTVMPVTLPEKPDALQYAARQGQVHACIIYQEPNTKRVFVFFVNAIGTKKRRWWIILSEPSWRQSTLRCRANPSLFRMSFEPFDQMLYHRMVLEPHAVYPIPLPPPTPAHVPSETNKRPLEEQLGPSSNRNRVFITPVIRLPVAPVLIARPSTALATAQPVIIPEPSVLTTPQTLLQSVEKIVEHRDPFKK